MNETVHRLGFLFAASTSRHLAMCSPSMRVLLLLLVSSTSSSVSLTQRTRPRQRILLRSSALANAAMATDTVLHDEAAAGNAIAVELLLAAGVEVNARNEWKSTPLHLAAVNGHGDVVSLLLEHGAEPNAANEDGNTPLHAAVGRGHLQCVQRLLSGGARADAVSNAGMRPFSRAAQKGDAALLSAMVEAGVEMDDALSHDAFWAAVQMCEAAAGTQASHLPAAVPQLLRLVFEADLQQLINREKLISNVTCMQPAMEGTGTNLIDEELVQLTLREGRVCEGGECCAACSRVAFPLFATATETEAFLQELQHAIVPPLHQFSLQKCAFRDMRTTLLFVRFVERMRRAIAHEYGLPLSSVLPMQTFVSCFIGAQDRQGGLHSDESTHPEFHYSAVLYLSTQGQDFEGGTFSWNDPPAPGQGSERVITPLSPSRGAAIIFSAGWENMHEVEPLASGTRFAIPSFFTTCPVDPNLAGTPPVDDQAVADELWRTLLVPEAVGDFRQFMARWHTLLGAVPAGTGHQGP